MARRTFGTVERRKREDGTFKPGYYAKFTWKSRRYVRSGGPEKSHARRKLDAAHGLLKSGVAIEDVLSEVFGDFCGSRLTFREASALYLEYAKPRKRDSTFSADVSRFRVLCKEPWAEEYLARVTPEHISRHVQRRLAAGSKPGTVNRDLAAISALFRWAIIMSYADENPVRRVERPSERDSGRETYLTATECRALVDAAEGVTRDMIEFALGTGCRRGEFLKLQWRAVTLGMTAAESNIRIEPVNAKTGRGRTVPLAADLFKLMVRRHRTRPLPHLHGEDSVFVEPCGSPVTEWRLRRGFARAINKAKTSAARADLHEFASKLDSIRVHDMRHTAASLMVAAGVPIFDVSKILGHSTLQMTLRYAHFVPEAGRAAVDALARALARRA